MRSTPFWRRKRLDQMTRKEWESLCDGCGKCCLHKLEDVDTGEIAITNVACAYLEADTCRCRDYANRQANVPDCVKLTRTNISKLKWLPDTCSYRLVHQGNELPLWHHLVCGDSEAVHEAGQSIQGRVVSESDVRDLESYVVDWLNDADNNWDLIADPDKENN